LNNYFGAWRALEELYQAGHVRAIGVSNFDSVRIADISHFSEVTPAVNQIEINPFHQRADEISYMRGKVFSHKRGRPLPKVLMIFSIARYL